MPDGTAVGHDPPGEQVLRCSHTSSSHSLADDLTRHRPFEGGRASQNGFATNTYRDGDVFTGALKAAAPSQWRSTSASSDHALLSSRRRVSDA